MNPHSESYQLSRRRVKGNAGLPVDCTSQRIDLFMILLDGSEDYLLERTG
jgi:hypothetical protein